MTEPAIKSNERESTQLFERGVAAARGGQRRVAAVLLARAVQLNPRHEMGWLWLSGVLDEPDAIAFCLRSVLAINPHNERARQGLEWLEERAMIARQPAPPISAPEPAPAAPDERERERESWWVGWRRSRHEMGRARLVFWAVPILLLLLTLVLNIALRDARDRNIVLAQAAAAPPPAIVRLAPPAILQAALAPVGDAQALAYLSEIEAPRARLRDAVKTYRDSTSQPGGSSVAHAAAARALRATIDSTSGEIDAIVPPAALAPAHNSYLAGLEIERQALDDMLEFYSSFRVQFANRATLRMVDAERQLGRARARFDALRSSATAPLPPRQSAR
ncbi:MAG: hypothetical protein IPO81_15260 [Kouleothrix sp.]|nr:hypothetical protein [Kouleothrix sp.]